MIKLYSFTSTGSQLLASSSATIAHWFVERSYGKTAEEVVIVTPHAPFKNDHLENSEKVLWYKIHHAWQKIQSSRSGTEMHAWRTIGQYGEAIAPGLRVFRLRDSNSTRRYFYLLPEGDFYEVLSQLINLFPVLSAWWHLQHDRGLFHAAGVARDNQAYLLVGPSGAGKSTASKLSLARGYKIIHDDHVVVCPTNANRYMVADRSLSTTGIPLRRIFFLNQNTTNQLIPLSSLTSTKKLLESLFDYAGNEVFLGQSLRRAFATSAAIARSIPCYELHFRKSPDFWDVIDAELGN